LKHLLHQTSYLTKLCKFRYRVFLRTGAADLQVFDDEDGLALVQVDPHLSARPEDGLVGVVRRERQQRLLARVEPAK
jgi:hypothetical protein